MPSLTYLGATQTVTGSKYLLEAAGERLMIDCGLFQGRKELRLRNWNPFPVDPSSIHWVVLTHAHLDHTGYLPRLVRDGFRGQVRASSSTVDLFHLSLPDSGHLQEEDASYVNRKDFNSPMAIYVTDLYRKQHEDHNLQIEELESGGRRLFAQPNVHFDRSVEDSKALNECQISPRSSFPPAEWRQVAACSITSKGACQTTVTPSSLWAFSPREPEARLFNQAPNSSRFMASKFLFVPQIETIENLGGHADYGENLGWIGNFAAVPKKTFITHGELHAANELQQRLATSLGWQAEVPSYLEKTVLRTS